jgi:DNA-binding CsgD family transcriptional regulator
VLEKLSVKERRIVELVARGRTNYEVAERLHLSHKTVDGR